MFCFIAEDLLEQENNEVETEAGGGGTLPPKLTKPRPTLPYSPYNKTEDDDELSTDAIFQELLVKPTAYAGQKLVNATTAVVQKGRNFLYEEFLRGKRGSIDLRGIVKCATNCNPLQFIGYGCYCGFLGDGEPVDGIDT